MINFWRAKTFNCKTLYGKTYNEMFDSIRFNGKTTTGKTFNDNNI